MSKITLHRIGIVLVAALACVGQRAWAGTVGPEFRVNTTTAGEQVDPHVATLTNGGFVVIWESPDQIASTYISYGIYGQRYSSAGARIGAQFKVNTHIARNQYNPSVAALSGGGFVVTWQSQNQDSTTGDGIYGQRYSATGARAGIEFRVNTYVQNDQGESSVSGLGDGGFIVTWTSSGQDGSTYGVYGQRYNGAGMPIGAEFRVNTHTLSDQRSSSVAALSDGGFVVAWDSFGQDGSDDGIYGQRYDAAGTPIGAEFRVNTYTTDFQSLPSVAALSDGGFVVAWQSERQDGSDYGVYGQRYNAAGTRVGAEFQVNRMTVNNQWLASVAALSDGGFVITWTGRDGSIGVRGQRYNAAGARVFGELRANSYTTGEQSSSSVAALSNGGFVIVWQSDGQDGSGYGIYGQRYSR